MIIDGQPSSDRVVGRDWLHQIERNELLGQILESIVVAVPQRSTRDPRNRSTLNAAICAPSRSRRG